LSKPYAHSNPDVVKVSTAPTVVPVSEYMYMTTTRTLQPIEQIP